MKTCVIFSVILLFSFSCKKKIDKSKFSAKNYTFDGFKLGDPFFKISANPPYSNICDIDPIDKRAKTAVFLPALPCSNGKAFPQDTSVIFYLKYSRELRTFQKIENFIYFQGDFFKDKTNFPIRIGEKIKKYFYLFNESSKFTIRRGDTSVDVFQSFSKDIYAFCLGESILGFVFGKMPENSSSEQWEAIVEIYVKYTNRATYRKPIRFKKKRPKIKLRKKSEKKSEAPKVIKKEKLNK
jgi:hypothetical protein